MEDRRARADDGLKGTETGTDPRATQNATQSDSLHPSPSLSNQEENQSLDLSPSRLSFSLGHHLWTRSIGTAAAAANLLGT